MGVQVRLVGLPVDTGGGSVDVAVVLPVNGGCRGVQSKYARIGH